MPGRHDPNSYRTDCRILVPTARRLYEEGKSRSEVLEAIYGIDLPPEALLFLRDYVSDAKHLEASWLYHPWQLMIPPEKGGLRFEIGPLSLGLESRAFVQAPHVLLLGSAHYHGALHGRSLFGYDLDELHAGRTTIVGLKGREVPESGADFTVFGSSLLEFFHTLISRHHVAVQGWSRTDVYYLYDDTALDDLEEQLRGIEALQRELICTAG